MTGLAPRSVPLSSIDPEDALFRVGPEEVPPLLAASIKKLGLFSPPVLQEKAEGGFRVVSGFKRVKICRDLGLDEIPALVAEAGADRDRLAFIAASENAALRPLTVMEQARCVAILGPGRPWPERAAIIGEAIGLSANPRHLAQLESLARLSGFIRAALESGAIAFATALQLGELDPKCAFSLTTLFSGLRVSLSKQREIIEAITDVAGREGISVSEVLAMPEVAESWRNEPDRGLASARLREKLRALRLPNLVKAEAAARENIRALKLPEGVSWEPPAFFEGDVHTINIKVKSAADLEKLRGLVADLLANPALSGIFS